ncbi:MAG: TPM domain-containing protein [Prevotella sp.]|nr:TPM domain-containing protein [Prevotella sp.]
MGKFFKSIFSGVIRAVVPWLLFGLLIPILFFAFHPFDPIVVFGACMVAVALFFINKWGKEMPAAKKATEEAVQAGAKFVDVHPTDENQESPLKRFKNKFYPMLFTSLLSASMLSCSYQAIHESLKSKGRTVAVAQQGESREWNANTIEMVHLQDSNLYVTNSDTILSAKTVDSLNILLKAMDKDLGVKPAMVICHSLAGGDSYRTAVDLINKYGIGSKDEGKGVCIVVAYDQQSLTIAPTSNMEGELTDAECNQLGERFVVSYMKLQQPDSAMLYLADGMYRYLESKRAGEAEMPAPSVSKKRWLSSQLSLNVLCILVLCFLFGYLEEENIWTKPKKATKAVDLPDEDDNDDEKPSKVADTQPRPENKGGSYGGGRSGGGGATIKW